MNIYDEQWFRMMDMWELIGHPDAEWEPPHRYIGEDKPVVKHSVFNFHPPREYGDNDPSDPENNWDTDNFKEQT